jgi:hypothetical protein
MSKFKHKKKKRLHHWDEKKEDSSNSSSLMTHETSSPTDMSNRRESLKISLKLPLKKDVSTEERNILKIHLKRTLTKDETEASSSPVLSENDSMSDNESKSPRLHYSGTKDAYQAMKDCLHVFNR